MKFDRYGQLRFKDVGGDRLLADVYHRDETGGFLIVSVNGTAVAMSREEARKFAKAIRKEVRKVQL